MKFIRDTMLIFASNVKTTLRNPVWVIMGLFQPVCYLLLFAPLLNSVLGVSGFPPGGELQVFLPGLLIFMGILGAAYVGFGLIADLRSGLIERLRVTPVSRLALLFGRALRDVLFLLAQSVLLILVASLLGLQVNPVGGIMTLGLLAVVGLFTSACSYALALALKNENALAPTLNFFALPLLLLSGIILPLTLAPRWLRNIATLNPFAHAVNAARALFNGNIGDAVVWRGFAVMTVLAALALWWAARSFRQAIV